MEDELDHHTDAAFLDLEGTANEFDSDTQVPDIDLLDCPLVCLSPSPPFIKPPRRVHFFASEFRMSSMSPVSDSCDEGRFKLSDDCGGPTFRDDRTGLTEGCSRFGMGAGQWWLLTGGLVNEPVSLRKNRAFQADLTPRVTADAIAATSPLANTRRHPRTPERKITTARFTPYRDTPARRPTGPKSKGHNDPTSPCSHLETAEMALEQEFCEERYPKNNVMMDIAHGIGWTLTEVQMWFQMRRRR
ncbi:hypothetical protein SpCBS45565_g03384 [Spizellomyces sp. 'palustris']|nr:hypothetical protein SpCBS45565_g03384 [Spizellomyces sp. 'palustris']